MEDPKVIAEVLNEALNGKHKEEIVYKVIIGTDLAKKLQIAEEYKKAYNKELYDVLKSKLSGEFKALAIHLFLPPVKYYAKLFKKAFKGLSKDEDLIFELLTSFAPDDLKKIAEAYNEETKKDLVKDIEKAFSGALQKDVMNLMTVPRKTSDDLNKDECEKKCERLIEAGESNWVNDDALFKDIFVCSSAKELIMICRYYFAKTQKNLFEVVEKKLSGKAKSLMKELLYNNICPYDLYAEKIRTAIKGLGTDNDKLDRVLIERCGIDMNKIAEIYPAKYKRTLKEDIIGDTSGWYQKLCLFLAGVEEDS